MLSDKQIVRDLVEICTAKGIEYVVISPGSRNAPLNISFNEDGRFQCLSVPDERVAGFFALGIAQQTQKPVIITCTSGSATLNFAPAICEAYYQRIPLLVLTANRPVEWMHQGNGQTINQRDIFRNYIKKSYQLIQEATHRDDVWHNNRMISEAIDQTLYFGAPGPVHIDIPLREPLYDTKDYADIPLPKSTNVVTTTRHLSDKTIQDLAAVWNQCEKKMILCGLLPQNQALNTILEKISDDASVVILTETTSNLIGERFFPCIDRLIFPMTDETFPVFKPDLLITIGHSVISKKIKALLRQHRPKIGWHIGLNDFYLDTFQALTTHISTTPNSFFRQLHPHIRPISSAYYGQWKIKAMRHQSLHQIYLKQTPWSDLKAFELILKALPHSTNLHQGNSTPVRYIQLFKQRPDIAYNSNRGVAGIDGCTSTAAGAALVNGRPTTIITGDISFFYDSNAFWNHHLTPNLRIILINNGGGNIFRFIKGPDTTNQLETFFETHHTMTAKPIAELFNLTYYHADNPTRLIAALKHFYQPHPRPAILEIQTPRFKNDKILRKYFEFMR